MKKNLLTLTLLSMLTITLAGCGDKKESSTPSGGQTSNSANASASNSAEPSYGSIQQVEDIYGSIPKRILDAKTSIDFYVYIEGQEGRIPDIGHYSNDPSDTTKRYHPQNITSIEMARYFGAAAAFKELAPGVEINLMFCSIADYPTRIRAYQSQYGHLPHLMWGTDHVVEMLSYGWNYDLSRYADTEYYQQYNEYFMSRFKFGEFQAAFPISAEPWGVLVNIDDLVTYNQVSSVIDEDTGLPSQEYKDWVEDFTWDRFMKAAEAATDYDHQHAGLSQVVEYFTSYSVPSINNQFVRNGNVDLTSPEVESTLNRLFNYENQLTNYTAWDYNPETYGPSQTLNKKDGFDSLANWDAVNNFTRDHYFTFYAEAPWAVGTVAQRVKMYNTNSDPLDNVPYHYDYLPYPKLDSDSEAFTGIAVEGLTVGNQCPVGTVCSEKSQLDMDVAAYFAMFMGLDPRSIESKANITYVFNDNEYHGDVSFPLCKRHSYYGWQQDPEFKELYPDGNPAEDYDDNWQYQLAKWFEINDLYVTNDDEPDVNYFENITPGLVKMLDTIYMIDGMGEDYVTCINYWNEPVAVPTDNGDDNSTATRDFFYNWQARFRIARNTETQAGVVSSSEYVSSISAMLKEIEEDINQHSEIAWSYLQECVDTYYGPGRYDVLNRDVKNDYEGFYPGY